MQEFGLPYPLQLPEETHVDEKGRIWFSVWTMLGFLERRSKEMKAEFPDLDKIGSIEDALKGGRPRPPKKPGMMTFNSNIN